jgi:hypothetical protein
MGVNVLRLVAASVATTAIGEIWGRMGEGRVDLTFCAGPPCAAFIPQGGFS